MSKYTNGSRIDRQRSFARTISCLRCSPRWPPPPEALTEAPCASSPCTRRCSLLKILFAVRASEAPLKIGLNKVGVSGGASQRRPGAPSREL